jgi:CHASE3 domain sensor protein
MKRTVVGYLRLAFGLSLLFLIVTSIASFISIQSLLTSSNKVNHTHTVIRDLESVLSIVKDAESGQRAYLITGDVKYLKPFVLAKEKALQRLNRVKQLTADNAVQQKSLNELQKIIELKLEELENLIALRKVNEAHQEYFLNIEKDLMDSAKVLVKEMQLREYSLLSKHRASLNRFSTYSPILILLVSICALIMTYYFYSKVKHQIQVTNYFQREHELMLKKDEFLSIASHELKTPITNMKGYLQILESICVKDGNLAYKNFTSKANKQAEKLTSLVNDLLNVSKIQAGKLDVGFCHSNQFFS